VTLSSVDEKIAVLYSHANSVKHWNKQGIDSNLMQSQIVADMFAHPNIFLIAVITMNSLKPTYDLLASSTIKLQHSIQITDKVYS
jgi:hypothetical protein